jgi:hypothetical protein
MIGKIRIHRVAISAEVILGFPAELTIGLKYTPGLLANVNGPITDKNCRFFACYSRKVLAW